MYRYTDIHICAHTYMCTCIQIIDVYIIKCFQDIYRDSRYIGIFYLYETMSLYACVCIYTHIKSTLT